MSEEMGKRNEMKTQRFQTEGIQDIPGLPSGVAEWNFDHVRSSSDFPQSSGAAERLSN